MTCNILVAEDDETINEVVSEYLKDSGMHVLSAKTGADAQQIITGTLIIDLFILDIMLPETSGLELLRIIRRHSEYKNTPVIMLTALADEQTQLDSFEFLADDYVTKPFSPKVLVKRVQALLRRKGTTCLRIGGLRIDPESYEAFENDRLLSLTVKELELLKALMQNEGHVLSRQQLLNIVWGYDYFGDERLVDAHIKNLRKKLTNNVITTIKGIGYKIDSPKNAAAHTKRSGQQ